MRNIFKAILLAVIMSCAITVFIEKANKNYDSFVEPQEESGLQKEYKSMFNYQSINEQ